MDDVNESNDTKISKDSQDLSTYPTDIKIYNKLRIIGKGSFGQVWEARIKLGLHQNEHVAIKEVDLEDLADKNLENLSQEITIMSSIQHENLIKTYTTCTSGHKINIVMPLMNAGIKDEAIIATIMKSCLEGLICLNKNNLYHRDIKAGNILLSTEGLIKLGDFGVAACLKPEAKKNSYVGSLNWMAPEVIKQVPYDDKIDIWSLGITAIEIAQRNPPYFGMGTFEIMREIAFGDPMTHLKNHNSYSAAFIDFIKSCLIKDPKLRPNAENVLKMNKKFFSLVKDKNYFKENLLCGVPTVQERFEKGIVFISPEPEIEERMDSIKWNFDLNEFEKNGEISNKTNDNHAENVVSSETTKKIFNKVFDDEA